MRKQQAEKRLARAGFAIDWGVTGATEDGFAGTIDPIGRNSINGDCRGCAVGGDNAADFYARAVREAEELAGDLAPCDKTECDFHDA